ncbi:MAG: HAD family hydrolase [Marmoricola sp.]|nr:HAD family hydrolase [Marmoricola sp.]
MRPDLVIFDCDGVLVDTEVLQVAVEARVLTEIGWQIEPDEVVRRWMGRTAAAQTADIRERLGEEGVRRYDELARGQIHEAFERDLVEVEGVSSLLDALDAAGLPACVASSGSHERIRRTLGLTGLLPRFEGRIYSALDVEHGKPAPDLFLHAAARLGVPPSRCVVVEDSAYGVQAGVAAGMRVLGYGSGLADPQSLRAAGAEVFDRMADVPALVGVG